jgi:hypothetical protein
MSRFFLLGDVPGHDHQSVGMNTAPAFKNDRLHGSVVVPAVRVGGH